MTFQVTVDRARLQEVMRKYGVDNWTVDVDETFCTPIPHLTVCSSRTIHFRPLGWLSLLAYLFGKHEYWHAMVLSHETRHACQYAECIADNDEPPPERWRSALILLRYGYWWHPMEVDAREWASQNWREFRGIVTITRT